MLRMARWVLLCCLVVGTLIADNRFIVRVVNGPDLGNACAALGCNVVESLGDAANQLFLITAADAADSGVMAAALSEAVGLLNIEPDLLVRIPSRPHVDASGYGSESAMYFGHDVLKTYVWQPAALTVQIQQAQATFGLTGVATVAVIDTGVDPDHPAIRDVLVPGYDFISNQEGYGPELQAQSTVGVVDRTDGTLGDIAPGTQSPSSYAAFGHGTMVAGIVHLVAPQAMIMPLKAFQADGSGYVSDVLRAIYRAARTGARVINMSFDMPDPSVELRLAVDYANAQGIICVASAGDQGLQTLVYPAAFSNVIGVASTASDDTRSGFSNYGEELVRVAAPGEAIVTTFPHGGYATGSGTSLSAAFVSGTAALMLQARWNMSFTDVTDALTHARPLAPEMGHGRLDVFQAIQAAWSAALMPTPEP